MLLSWCVEFTFVQTNLRYTWISITDPALMVSLQVLCHPAELFLNFCRYTRIKRTTGPRSNVIKTT